LDIFFCSSWNKEVEAMSEYDVSEMEVEDQSEDGEITKSPHKHSPMQLSKDDTAFRYVRLSF
jgi:hypothetical protein